MRVRIRKGLDLPLGGGPEQVVCEGPPVRRVAVLTLDDPRLRARAVVEVGERVRLGQALFVDRRRPGIRFTSPASGTVADVLVGERRRVTGIVVELEGDDEETFSSWTSDDPAAMAREDVEEALLLSGLWTALTTRPFSDIPDPGTEPDALFVTAVDTNPLAADPAVVIAPRARDFAHGLSALTTLTRGPVYVCQGAGAALPAVGHDRLVPVTFDGPHPAGLPGTHVHLLAPVGRDRTAWHVGHQDVLAIGHLFSAGRLDAERVISVAGPPVRRPALVRTLRGAHVGDLVAGRLNGAQPTRVIAGSVLSGRTAAGDGSWLGRHHLQVSVVPEPSPEARSGRPFTVFRRPRRTDATSGWTTALHGRPTGLVPTGAYDDVFPFDIPPVPLLRALETGNVEAALDLGCLELAEEDLALLSFVSPAKIDHGARLSAVLSELRKELVLA